MSLSTKGNSVIFSSEVNSNQEKDTFSSPLRLIILIGLAIGIIFNAGITQSPTRTQENIEFFVIDVSPIGFDGKGTPIYFVIDFMIKNNGLLHLTLKESTLNFILIDPDQRITLLDYSSFPEIIELKRDHYITKQVEVNLNPHLLETLDWETLTSEDAVKTFEEFIFRFQLISNAQYIFQSKIISLNYDFSWKSFNNITL